MPAAAPENDTSMFYLVFTGKCAFRSQIIFISLSSFSVTAITVLGEDLLSLRDTELIMNCKFWLQVFRHLNPY